jgi:5'-methylthioadenosine phosphorylase
MSETINVGLIGGTGLGAALGSDTHGRRHDVETPFGKPSDAIVESEWTGLPVLFLNRHGPGHLLNPSAVPYRANIFALKQLGCTHIIASGAVGSLREEIQPRSLVIPDQIIDKTSKRAGTFFENAAVHVEFAEPFCPVLRQILVDAGKARSEDGGSTMENSADASAPSPSSTLHPPSSSPTVVHDRGCYVCMEGPAFSTRAESLMHRLWGGDLVGMTAMPEAKLAREAEISYTLVALVTDYDCWRQKPGLAPATAEKKVDPRLLLEEIKANLQAVSASAARVIRSAVALMATKRAELEASPAQSALKLAIWSDKSKILRDEVRRLGPLWMRYFEGVE